MEAIYMAVIRHMLLQLNKSQYHPEKLQRNPWTENMARSIIFYYLAKSIVYKGDRNDMTEKSYDFRALSIDIKL